MTSEIEYEVSERIARIQINRPKAMNSIHPGLMAELSAAIRRADDDPEVQRTRTLVASGPTLAPATTSSSTGRTTIQKAVPWVSGAC